MLHRLLMLIILFILSVWDIRFQRIPKKLLAAGTIPVMIGFIVPLFSDGPPADRIYSLFTSLLGGLPGLVIIALSYYSDKVGRADGIVISVAGIGESVMFSMILMCMSCVLMALPACILLAAHKVHRNTRLPYIPFVTAAYLLLILSSVRIF